MTNRDLLTPEMDHSANYVHQLRQTLNAYLPSYVYIGEALQNALDATREAGGGPQRIDVHLDLPARRVSVQDYASGFPNEPRLLYLGGGTKQGRGYGGLIGVGLKVVLFSSSEFELRARSGELSLRYSLDAADTFAATPRPSLAAPEGSFDNDPEPLTQQGTLLTYAFSRDGSQDAHSQFFRLLDEETTHRQFNNLYSETLTNSVKAGAFPNRFAALLALHLKRNSYLGLTTVPNELRDTEVNFSVKTDADALPATLAALTDGQTDFSFKISPSYVYVEEPVTWAPTNRRRPRVTDKPLLNGGSGLSRTDLGFNCTSYSNPQEYETLLTNAAGRIAVPEPDITSYRSRLFPRMRSVQLAIGRVQEFERYLPGGARHVLSANGVVTTHAVEFNRGQNQQYVRCFDVTVDVNAELNYGKTQLNDMQLVGLFRRFLNDAYAITLQHAAKNYVGKLKDIHEDNSDEFFSRPDLSTPLTQRKLPRSENDVIALTFELAGRGFLPEYRWYGLSNKDTYDARAIIRRPYDAADYLDDAREGKLRIVEFKLRASNIARDFMQKSKDPTQLDLLVAYELGEVPVAAADYQLLTLEASRQYSGAPDKVFPGVKHVVYDANTGAEVQVLLIREVLASAFPDQPPAEALQADVSEDD